MHSNKNTISNMIKKRLNMLIQECAKNNYIIYFYGPNNKLLFVFFDICKAYLNDNLNVVIYKNGKLKLQLLDSKEIEKFINNKCYLEEDIFTKPLYKVNTYYNLSKANTSSFT